MGWDGTNVEFRISSRDSSLRSLHLIPHPSSPHPIQTRGNPFTEPLKERGLSFTPLALFLNPTLTSVDVVAVRESDVALASRLFRREMVGVRVSL